MDTIKLDVQQRNEKGNGPSRRLRSAGRIPAIVYGRSSTPTPVSISFEDLKAAMAHGQNVVLELSLKKDDGTVAKSAGSRGDAVYAVVKEMQFHPIRRQLLHVDLHKVDLSEEIEALVPIELIGTPAGLADGGILDWSYREVAVRALPIDVPASIEIDVSELLIGQHLTVESLVAVEGVTIIDDPQTLVVALVPPAIEEEEEEEDVAAEEASEQPEVIGDETSEE